MSKNLLLNSKKEIKNFYEIIPKEKKLRNPGYPYLQLDIPFQMLIVAPTGQGKTNIILNIIEKTSCNGGTFTKVVICCKTRDEPLYNFLSDKVPEVEFYEEGQVPDLKEFQGEPCSLIVFDDLVLMKDQSKINEHFIRGRKLHISVIYLTQSYFKTPKTIRINCRYIIIKKLSSKKDLKLLLSEYDLGIGLDEILQLYNNATQDFTSFLLIDTKTNTFKKNFLGE